MIKAYEHYFPLRREGLTDNGGKDKMVNDNRYRQGKFKRSLTLNLFLYFLCSGRLRVN